MHLVGMHFRTQGRVDPLMALNRALALEFGRDDGGVPVAAIALERDVLAREMGLDQGLEFVGGQGNWNGPFSL